MQYKKTAILMAMEQEALPLIRHYDLEKTAYFNPVSIYSNKDESIVLSLNGKSEEYGVDNIGSQAATLNAYIVIQNYSPDIIINCGTAGGFSSKNAEIGDVYISNEKIIYHDRRISLPGGYSEYGIGHYNSLKSDKIAERLGLKQGIISTGDAFDLNEYDLKIMQENDVDVKEMEAAGIAWVCQLYKIDFIALKAITDFVDMPHATGEDFLKNLDYASKRLKTKTIELLNYLVAENS
ncbi:MAG TPA: hypothetical protein ENK91_14965 [Bacteroidetes bacterium]|nr:hypothetical protein [Bacteroidota bacterium]